MRTRVLLICALVAAVLTLGGIIAWNWNVAAVQETQFFIEVVDEKLVGINTGVDNLYFGSIPAGGFSERTVTLQSAEPRTAIIKIYGPQASWITVSENNIALAGDARHVTFRCTVPSDAASGNYSGTVRVEYRRW